MNMNIFFDVRCPECNHSKIALTKDPWKMDTCKCKKCGALFSLPKPDKEKIQREIKYKRYIVNED